MIIVKTSNGDVFINDSELVKLTHDRHNHFVYATMKNQGSGGIGKPIRPIDKVETVIYVNEATDKERRDDGSELAFLRSQLADEKSMCEFMHTIAGQMEKKILYFANDIIQEVQYGDKIPDDVRKRIRDRAEENKAYALDKNKWWERLQFEEKYKQQAEDEANRTAALNDKIEEQAAQIFKLQQQLEQAKSEVLHSEFEIRKLEEKNNELAHRNLWQRIFNRQ